MEHPFENQYFCSAARIAAVIVLAAFAAASPVAVAQQLTPCFDPDGAPLAADECLNLPPVREATNLLPLILPVFVGGGALAALATGGGGTASATGTTLP